MPSFVIEGGLGNQLFQLASVIGYMQDNNQRHADLELGWFYTEIGVPRKLQLYNVVDFDALSEIGFSFSVTNKPFDFKKRLVVKLSRTAKDKLDWHIPFLPQVDYWQDSKYLVTGFNVLKKTLSIKISSNCFKDSTTAALHLRFGDYLNNPLYQVVDINNYLSHVINSLDRIHKIDLYTDDIDQAKSVLLSSKWDGEMNFCSGNELSDFFSLTGYSTVICVNSTFGVAASSIGKARTVFCPNKWSVYRDMPNTYGKEVSRNVI